MQIFFFYGVCVKNHTYVYVNGGRVCSPLEWRIKPSGNVFVLSKVQRFSSLIHTDAWHHVGSNVESKSGPC